MIAATLPANWVSLLRLLPGYDPFATAGECWFDIDAAQRALRFFPRRLHHIEGKKARKKERFILEPWEKAIVANIWGWKRHDLSGDVVRRYSEVLIYTPRKQGKTPLGAGMTLLGYFIDNEPGAQCMIAADSRKTAGKLYRHIKGMIDAEPALKKRCRPYGGNAPAGQSKSIVKHDDPLSFIQIISADAPGEHGGAPYIVVIDELHTQPDRALVDVLTTSMSSENIKQPLFIMVTTADFLRPSICNEKYEYACKVRDGIINEPSFLPVIYEAGPSDDWTSEAVWCKANPNLGVSVSLDYLRRECKKAQATPAYENTFRRLHLNQRTETDVRWIPDALWMQGPNSEPFDLEMLKGKSCWGGLDFGWREDYASFVLLFRIEGVYYVRPWFWLPSEGGRNKHLMPTKEFISTGLVSLTPGDTTDIESIYEVMRECRSKYDLREIVIDPSQARKQGQDLLNEGYEVFEFVQSKQNYNEPCQNLVALLKEGKLRHAGNKVLRWMSANCHTEENGLGQIMPKKKRSTEKIDGICALTMALGRALLDDQTGAGPGFVLLDLDNPQPAADNEPNAQPVTADPFHLIDEDDDW